MRQACDNRESPTQHLGFAMPDIPDMLDQNERPPLDEFGPTDLAEMHLSRRSAFFSLELEELPNRAIIAFALRCARRGEPLVRLQPLIADAYSSGLDVGEVTEYLAWGEAAEAHVYRYINVANGINAVGWAAADAAYPVAPSPGDAAPLPVAASAAASAAADEAIYTAANADLKKLLDLKLGKPGEHGEPIRWNDPRLGPLWPKGEPEWYVKAQQKCRELEEQLRNLPDPNAPPDDPLFIAQWEAWRKLDVMRDEGKLNEYRGEYVIWSNGTIFAHGRNLLKVRLQAEELAGAKGINPDQLLDYFVPGE
jgi:hypothetical protein